jgi:hypothetical protein
MGSMVVVEMGELVSMEVGAEGVGGGVVVVDTGELREATGTGEGTVVPTDVMVNSGSLNPLAIISSSSCIRCSIPIGELGVECGVGELSVVEDWHGSGCRSCGGGGGGARVSVDAEVVVEAVI